MSAKSELNGISESYQKKSKISLEDVHYRRARSKSGLHQRNMKGFYSQNDPVAVLSVVTVYILMR